MATQPNWWDSDPVVQPVFGPPPKPKPYEPPSGYIGGPDHLTPIPGGPADKAATDPKAQESERTAAYLATNLNANINLMNQALKVDPSVAKPTWGQWFAGIFGDTAENLASPEQRQIVNNSQKLITDAALTLGTGAAYTKEQLAAYQRGFFPQIGDGEDTIKAKHEALRAALVAARLKAGSQAPQIDAAMKALGMDPAAPLTAKPDDALKLAAPPPADNTPKGGDGTTPPGVGELNDDQKKAYAAFIASHGGKPSGDQVRIFLKQLLNVDDVPNADEIAATIGKSGRYSATTEGLSYEEKIKQRIAKENELGIRDDSATTLARQGGTLSLSDEAAGAGNALANVIVSPFTGKFDPVGEYRIGRDVERQRIEDARQQLGYGGTAIELVSGAASLGPSGALEALAPKAAAVQAGRAGAVGGALSGYGSGEGTDDSLTRAGVGALAGYALGRYAPAAVERVLPRRFRAPQGMAPDVANAAQAEGVDLIRPMVDPHSISDYGALESNVYSQPIIRGAAGRVRGQIEDRTLALGGDGTPLETDAAGGVVQSAGRRFIQRSKGVANTLYNRARDLAGDTRFVPKEAIGQVDAEIAALQPNAETNAGEIRFLEGLKNDLSTPGGKTVEELRQLRTSLRGRIAEQNLTATQAEARAIRSLDATQQDVAANVPEAASAFRRADTYYRERQTHIDDIIRRITGGKVGADAYQVSGEQAFQRLKSMASPGGDGRRLAALMRDLEPSERQDIAATIAQSLGRRSADEPFSTALFLSQARKLSPSARRTIFGPDGAQSIDNLRLLSRKLEEAEKDINRSRSATVLERQGIRTAARAFISGLAGIGGTAATGSVSGGLAGVAVAGAAMGASAARRVLSARAMVNPRVSRWLAESADVSTPPQAKEAARKLGVIIAREPALAQELKPVYDFLENRLELPLAAQPGQGQGNNE